jgi:DNA ligase-associated metallophosphoesterase
MQKPVSHKILEQQFWLTTERTMFWEDEKSLIVSDLHFGKTGHFRKSGIPIPASVYKEDLQRLVEQIQYFQPRELIIVGDMFHSRENRELDLFLKWRSDFLDIDFRLIRGNHDVLEEGWYKSAGIQLSPQTLSRQQFHFVHDITDHLTGKAEYEVTLTRGRSYFFSGHIHPAIRIYGSGKQSLCFPCFYFGKKYAVLPAFSRFTGTAVIYPDAEEYVFAIVNQELIRMQ